MRFPMKLFTDPRVERIGGCFGTQIGKTTILFACLGYVIDQDPGSTMLMYPTDNTGKAVSKDRIQPMIEDCPALRQHMTGRADDWQLLAYTLDRMTVRFASSESEASVRSHPMRYLFKDESSVGAPAVWAEADNRTKTFWNRKILEFSTPRIAQDSIWTYLGLKKKETVKGITHRTEDYIPTSGTSVYWYHVPCPHCGEFIRLEFDQVRWPDDCAIRELDARGWYECQACKKKILDSHKPMMLSKGEWISPNPGGRWVGLHLNSLYGPWDSCRFGAIAALYLRAKATGDPDQMAKFYNSYFALPYDLSEDGAVIIADGAIEHRRQRYSRNQIPEGVKALILGADVRETELHYVVQGWGANSESWRVSWGIVADELALEDWLKSAVWQHPTAGPMGITAGGIDCRYKTHEIVEMCRRLRFIRAVRGEDVITDPKNKQTMAWRTTVIDRDARGKAIPGGLQGYRVNTIYFKEMIYQRINRVDPKSPDLWHMPEDRDAVYEKHMQSEEEKIIRQRGSGMLKRVWVPRKGFEANHFLDCEVYGCAIAHAYKLFYLPPDAPVLSGYFQAGAKEQAKKAETGVRPAFVDPGRLSIRT